MNRTHLLRRVKFRQSMILIWNLSILWLVRRKPGESASNVVAGIRAARATGEAVTARGETILDEAAAVFVAAGMERAGAKRLARELRWMSGVTP